MLRKVLFVIIGVLLLAAGGLGWAGVREAVARSSSTEGTPCPEGYYSFAVLDLIQPGQQGSKVVEQGCRPADEEVATVVLEAVSPKELERPEYQPTETSPIVRGPSDSPDYRCVVVLKPLEEGGGASEPVCGSGRIELEN